MELLVCRQRGDPVAFVTTEGGLGDLSFNDMIADGLSKLKYGAIGSDR